MPIIQLRGVSFRRGEQAILSDLCWTLQAGEHWALLGANGSGKTTLLKILTGYAWPTSGSVTVLGKRYGEVDLREHRKTIGWVSASLEGRVPIGDTGLEVVASGYDASLGLYRALDKTAWERVRRILERVNASEVADKRFEVLSQGERQRILIARALVNEPRLLVLDEPCAGLDPLSRSRLLGDLAAFARADRSPTILIVTHHVEEIGPWLTHTMALKDGRSVAAGPTAQVLTDAVLSEVYSYPCTVGRGPGGYTLRVSD